MRKIYVLGLCLFLLACNGTGSKTTLSDSSNMIENEQKGANTLTPQQEAEGWRLLYDGKTTQGWHIYLKRTDGSAWKSVNGTLFLDPRAKNGWQTVGGGDLVSDSAYENFHLSLEWKISEKGNSGIIFGVEEDTSHEHSWHTGPEMQILDNNGHADGAIYSHRAGDLYDIIASKKEMSNGPGKWNTADVRVENGKLDLFLNGELLVSADMRSEEWKKLLAESKFKDLPAFGQVRKGHIVLQDHGDPVWFRNIRIREL
jgi:hypothetical protein